MVKLENFGFEQSVKFFKNHAQDTYIAPEKAGRDKELMLKLKHEGIDARESFINFAIKLSKEFYDLKFVKCSQWKRNNGRGMPMVIKDQLWIQLKNPKWKEQLQSVSLAFGGDNWLSVWVDIHHDNERLKNEPEFNREILDQQFHLLDLPLKNNTKYRIREEDYREYGSDDVETIKKKYNNSRTKPLIQVVTRIDSLVEKANSGKLMSETVETVRIIKSYYDYVMTIQNDNNCKDLADCINEEMNELNLKGEMRDAFVKQRVNQNIFRDRLLRKFNHCTLCNVNQPELLVASHIKPWSESSQKEQLDTDNGLLLCAGHDRLFDRGFISFDDEGKIRISPALSAECREALGITDDIRIDITDKNKKYLKYHRKSVFKE